MEEHTSELQSRRDLVCRLLLEKKPWPALSGRVAGVIDETVIPVSILLLNRNAVQESALLVFQVEVLSKYSAEDGRTSGTVSGPKPFKSCKRPKRNSLPASKAMPLPEPLNVKAAVVAMTPLPGVAVSLLSARLTDREIAALNGISGVTVVGSSRVKVRVASAAGVFFF